ncbi:MAG: hypothetical protein ABJB40_03725 [Acidobacteriota bacterium]
MRTRTSVVFVVAAILSVMGCGMLGGSKAVIPSEDDLRREYKKSKDDFKVKYDGKEIFVWGLVGSSEPSSGILHFKTSSSSDVDGTPYISCYIEKPDLVKFNDMHVQEGSMVRLKGTLKVEEGSMRLNNCKLEKFGVGASYDD